MGEKSGLTHKIVTLRAIRFCSYMQQEETTITFTFTIGGTFSVQAAFQRVVGRPRPR